jgi:hypothetical protein
MCLNENKLSEYLNRLLSDKSLVKKYYEKEAIVRNEHFLREIITAIQKLEFNLQFRLFTKSGAELDQTNYWETVYVVFFSFSPFFFLC